MINKAINKHRIVLERKVPVYDAEGNLLYYLYYWGHYYYNYFFDNNNKKATTERRYKQEVTTYNKYPWAEGSGGNSNEDD